MIEFGTPNIKTMSLKNRAACSDLILPMGRTSIHLEIFVNHYQQVGEAPGRLLQRTDEVQSPHGKRPRDGDGLQSMGREVYLSSVELATIAGPHDVSGVGDRGGPIETLPKCITHEGARRNVMAADAGVDVANQLLALGDGDASLHDAGGTALV